MQGCVSGYRGGRGYLGREGYVGFGGVPFAESWQGVGPKLQTLNPSGFRVLGFRV